MAAGTSLLNGFPAVNHGVDGCRRVTESVTRPVQVRHGTPDARLLAEITLAGGFTSFEGGGISYNIPYAKNVAAGQVACATGSTSTGCAASTRRTASPINREPFGPLTGTLVPPCIGHAVGHPRRPAGPGAGRQVADPRLRPGRATSLQDMAALAALRELADEYFREAGFTDYDLTTVFHQWMGGFPEDEAKAFAVIAWGPFVACPAGADKIIVKTPARGHGHPDQGGQRPGLKATRQVLNMMADQRDLHRQRRRRAGEATSSGARSAALMAGRARRWAGATSSRGVVRGLRGGRARRAVRPVHLQPGQGPAHARQRRLHPPLRPRAACPSTTDTVASTASGSRNGPRPRGAVSFQMVTDDIYAISKGKLVGRPQDEDPKALFAPGTSAFFFDDQRAIKAGAPPRRLRLRRQRR